MATFRFEMGSKSGTGTTQADSKGGFTSTANCLFCKSSFTASKKKGQNRTISYMESSVRSMAKSHYEKKHKE